MTEVPCLDCKHKRTAVPGNVCSKCGNTLCDKCWKKAGNALLWGNMMFGWGAMLLSSGKKRYKCKSCRSKSDLIAIGFILILVGGFFAYGWYMSNMA
jgi:ribosomal protein L37AE/L43A